jgi:4-diphosphocytidyl-2-C-methyl-D-erythritol kinase
VADSKKITLRSFAKINLSIDVLGKMPNGYHQVDMIMQQVELHDKVSVSWTPDANWDIQLGTNRRYLPTDGRNLGYKAAQTMMEYAKENFEDRYKGKIDIYIEKRIPVAAGLAGGSGNGAVVLLALNQLWNLKLNVKEICEMAAPLGSDVPFCVMGCARSNKLLGDRLNQDPQAVSCARATGTGTVLQPIKKGLDAYIVLCKPSIKVSTKEVYEGLELKAPMERPDNDELLEGLREKNLFKVTKNMINVLEIYTLKRYPIVMYTKNKASELGNPLKVLMSGSGPTVFAIYTNRQKAKSAVDSLKKDHRDTFLTKTTL